MVCSLHSVTTGSRDRANVSLIIVNNSLRPYLMGLEIQNSWKLKLGGFRISGERLHLSKKISYGTLETEN